MRARPPEALPDAEMSEYLASVKEVTSLENKINDTYYSKIARDRLTFKEVHSNSKELKEKYDKLLDLLDTRWATFADTYKISFYYQRRFIYYFRYLYCALLENDFKQAFNASVYLESLMNLITATHKDSTIDVIPDKIEFMLAQLQILEPDLTTVWMLPSAHEIKLLLSLLDINLKLQLNNYYQQNQPLSLFVELKKHSIHMLHIAVFFNQANGASNKIILKWLDQLESLCLIGDHAGSEESKDFYSLKADLIAKLPPSSVMLPPSELKHVTKAAIVDALKTKMATVWPIAENNHADFDKAIELLPLDTYCDQGVKFYSSITLITNTALIVTTENFFINLKFISEYRLSLYTLFHTSFNLTTIDFCISVFLKLRQDFIDYKHTASTKIKPVFPHSSPNEIFGLTLKFKDITKELFDSPNIESYFINLIDIIIFLNGKNVLLATTVKHMRAWLNDTTTPKVSRHFLVKIQRWIKEFTPPDKTKLSISTETMDTPLPHKNKHRHKKKVYPTKKTYTRSCKKVLKKLPTTHALLIEETKKQLELIAFIKEQEEEKLLAQKQKIEAENEKKRARKERLQLKKNQRRVNAKKNPAVKEKKSSAAESDLIEKQSFYYEDDPREKARRAKLHEKLITQEYKKHLQFLETHFISPPPMSEIKKVKISLLNETDSLTTLSTLSAIKGTSKNSFFVGNPFPPKISHRTSPRPTLKFTQSAELADIIKKSDFLLENFEEKELLKIEKENGPEAKLISFTFSVAIYKLSLLINNKDFRNRLWYDCLHLFFFQQAHINSLILRETLMELVDFIKNRNHSLNPTKNALLQQLFSPRVATFEINPLLQKMDHYYFMSIRNQLIQIQMNLLTPSISDKIFAFNHSILIWLLEALNTMHIKLGMQLFDPTITLDDREYVNTQRHLLK